MRTPTGRKIDMRFARFFKIRRVHLTGKTNVSVPLYFGVRMEFPEGVQRPDRHYIAFVQPPSGPPNRERPQEPGLGQSKRALRPSPTSIAPPLAPPLRGDRGAPA